jgi:hypothetical protein
MLIDQPSRMPTRKIAAAIIAGMVTGALQTAVPMLWPDFPIVAFLEQVDIWVQGAAMTAAAYIVRDRA